MRSIRCAALPRALLAWLACLSTVACGDLETSPQIVKGSVEVTEPTLSISEARAWRGDTVMAASPLDADRAFLLALPVGGPYRLELARQLGGEPIPLLDLTASAPMLLSVCSVGEPIALGVLHVEAQRCRSSECDRAREELQSCKDGCIDLGLQVGCAQTIEQDCPPNEREMIDQRSCVEEHWCSQLERDCTARCLSFEELGELCAQPAPTCGERFTAMAWELSETPPMGCADGTNE